MIAAADACRPRRSRRRESGPGRAWSGLVAGRRPGSEPTYGAQHVLRAVVQGAGCGERCRPRLDASHVLFPDRANTDGSDTSTERTYAGRVTLCPLDWVPTPANRLRRASGSRSNAARDVSSRSRSQSKVIASRDTARSCSATPPTPAACHHDITNFARATLDQRFDRLAQRVPGGIVHRHSAESRRR